MRNTEAIHRRKSFIVLCVLVLLASPGSGEEVDGLLSPNESIALRIRSSSDSPLVFLVQESNGSELCHLPLSDRAAQWVAHHGVEQILWAPDGDAVAVTVSDAKASEVYTFIKDVDGTWRSRDLSAVENGNRGKLGRPKEDFIRVEHSLLKWTDSSVMYDGKTVPYRLIWIRTRFWDHSGQRFTIQEPVSIKPNGNITWR